MTLRTSSNTHLGHRLLDSLQEAGHPAHELGLLQEQRGDAHVGGAPEDLQHQLLQLRDLHRRALGGQQALHRCTHVTASRSMPPQHIIQSLLSVMQLWGGTKFVFLQDTCQSLQRMATFAWRPGIREVSGCMLTTLPIDDEEKSCYHMHATLMPFMEQSSGLPGTAAGGRGMRH